MFRFQGLELLFVPFLDGRNFIRSTLLSILVRRFRIGQRNFQFIVAVLLGIELPFQLLDFSLTLYVRITTCWNKINSIKSK